MTPQQMADAMLSGTISYLESCPSITNIKLLTHTPCPKALLMQWEHIHGDGVFSLPKDLASFLLYSNGLSLIWNTVIGSSVKPLGRIHINSLEYIVPVDKQSIQGAYLSDERAYHGRPIKGFVLDDCLPFGQVCICYISDASPSHKGHGDAGSGHQPTSDNTVIPQIWLYESSTSKWTYVAESFSAYYRLMIANLGIHGWQMAYSSSGLSPCTSDWLCMYAPTRAALYRKHHTSKLRGSLEACRGIVRHSETQQPTALKINGSFIDEAKICVDPMNRKPPVDTGYSPSDIMGSPIPTSIITRNAAKIRLIKAGLLEPPHQDQDLSLEKDATGLHSGGQLESVYSSTDARLASSNQRYFDLEKVIRLVQMGGKESTQQSTSSLCPVPHLKPQSKQCGSVHTADIAGSVRPFSSSSTSSSSSSSSYPASMHSRRGRSHPNIFAFR
ncbi:hypothetical protein BASA50_005350 [Batrachochytrium salamandrivorans]|uniref:Knr4/Smi1-like domain-containing protein n=1 Tax=Batrachochytrium salamandrivorans TaxID=1357716 RepID=A0ABQ8FFK9_9FUNG|nr:hypothetical protein BASA50_005350 [Batrachochytrium salamandrivorans]KAH9273820.1 hypothetical protein BASA83_003814 [Batrachochytrium salamandrivorans]